MTLTPQQIEWIQKQPDAQTLLRKLNEKKVPFHLFQEIFNRYNRTSKLDK